MVPSPSSSRPAFSDARLLQLIQPSSSLARACSLPAPSSRARVLLTLQLAWSLRASNFCSASSFSFSRPA
ncbi:hypothetical protein Zm00014a_012536 [Zea mays]|uniref:Uncharacterized protein n=1 Tax=Zea mays TaxID=4577 RepID=A0A3L6GDE6_MAIZE|nr:hypothetical protein Zm00014a_012536 [Zea mays]